MLRQVGVDHITLTPVCFSAPYYEASCMSGACLVALVEEINHTLSFPHGRTRKSRRSAGALAISAPEPSPPNRLRLPVLAPPSERRAHLREPPRRGSARAWRLSQYSNRTSPGAVLLAAIGRLGPSPQTWVARVLFSNLAPGGPVRRGREVWADLGSPPTWDSFFPDKGIARRSENRHGPPSRGTCRFGRG